MRPVDVAAHRAHMPRRIDKVDFMVWRIGKINLVTFRDREVMRLHTLHHHGLRAIWPVGDDPLPVMLAGVQPAVKSKRDSVSAAASFFPDRDLPGGIELVY